MDYRDIHKTLDIVTKISEAAINSEQLSTINLANKAKLLAEKYPHDATCVGMSGFLTRRANKSLLITRAEFRDVYQKIAHSNNKFVDPFKEELGFQPVEQKKANLRDPQEGMLVSDYHKHMGENFDSLAHAATYEELSSYFNKETPKGFTKYFAELATKACARELNSLGCMPKKLEAVAGNEEKIICNATYNTPKGQASVLIPVEVMQGRALAPSCFLDVNGLVRLNEKSLSDFLNKTAGKKFLADPQQLLKVAFVKKAAESNEVENLLNKVLTSRGTKVEAAGIILKEIDPEHIDVKIAKPKVPAEVESVAAKLASPAGEAEFNLGKDVVSAGRKLVHFETKKAGFANPQISVVSSAKDSVSYAVSAGKLGFKATVKLANGKIQAPKVVIANGMVYEFSSEGLNQILSNGDTDSKASAQASPLYELKASELVNVIHAAMNNNNFAAASEALHVLGTLNDKVAYQRGYELYVSGLKGELKVEDHNKCSAPRKLASSQQMICSHTGLPLNKVFQDKYGNCLPLYRKNLENSSTEAVSTIVSKIYFD